MTEAAKKDRDIAGLYARVISAYDSGRTVPEVARMVGLQEATVDKLLEHREIRETFFGEKPEKSMTSVTTANWKTMVAQHLHEKGYSNGDIAKELDISEATVRALLA